MFVTKHLAELCSLFIDDVYGELPSRIFSTLLTRGRSTVHQLAQYTALTPRQLRHGLAILIQHNLLYYSSGGAPTAYEANALAAYNLIRAGRILELVGSIHGDAAKDVVQSLMVLGNTKIGDLRDAYATRIMKNQAATQAEEDGRTNGDLDQELTHNGQEDPPEAKDSMPVESVDHLNSILCRLVEDELLVVVSPRMFQSFEDTYRDVQVEVEKKEWPQGIKGTKDKERYQRQVAERLHEIRDEGKKLKRKLEAQTVATKRRKVENGDVANGIHDIYSSPPLDPDAVLRVNHEKFLVELRNQKLADAIADGIGETTSQIYAVLLSLLTRKLSRCREHPVIDAHTGKDDSESQPYVTTSEVFDNLSPSLDVGSGIGKVDASLVDPTGVERIRRRRPRPKEPYVENEEEPESGDEDEGANGYGVGAEYDEELERHALKQQSEPPAQNGTKESRVKFKEAKTSESRLSLMRQHLLILCESTQGFLRHCGNGQWTVDFEPLIRRMQERELDTVIERQIGRHSLRLIRILRKRGKVDEKSLPMQAMMAKGTVHKIMLEMQMHGFVDVQEVPKDSTRNAKSTIFLWYCDTDVSLSQLLDNTYKTMLRCLQVREVHRQNAREVLRFVGRPDVKGREKEALEKKYYDRYDRYRRIEDKILGHVMRLDDIVGVLRDY